jgi:predicted DCC family thiol-disulfide oxidoreductase YuxK
VLYDADCGFCRWSLAKLLAWDRRRVLRPVPIDSREGERLLADMPAAQRLSSWHFVDSTGRRQSGGVAAVPLLRELPGGGPAAAAVLARFPKATERSYRWISEHRDVLARPLSDASRRRADARIERRRAA